MIRKTKNKSGHMVVVAIAALAMGASSLTGCYAPPPVYYVKGPPKAQHVPTPPPARRVDVPPPSPDQSYVWLDGYWHWDGSEYYWVEGRWAPPEPAYEYVAASYFFFSGAWYYRPCFWRHRRYRRHRRGGRAGALAGVGSKRPAPGRDRPAPPPNKTRRPAPEVGPNAKSRRRAPPAPSITSARQDGHTGRRAPSSPDRMAPVDQRQRRRPTVVLGAPGVELRRHKAAGKKRDARRAMRPDISPVRPGYSRDRTGAIVLSGRSRRLNMRRPTNGGGLTIVVPGRKRSTVNKPDRPRYRPSLPITPSINVRRRRVLLKNPGWNPSRRRPVPRVITPARRATTYRPTTSGPTRTYRPTRTRPTRTYRPTRTHRPTRTRSYSAPTRSVRSYRPPVRRSAPSRSYSRSNSSSSKRRAPASSSSNNSSKRSGTVKSTVRATSGFRRR